MRYFLRFLRLVICLLLSNLAASPAVSAEAHSAAPEFSEQIEENWQRQILVLDSELRQLANALGLEENQDVVRRSKIAKRLESLISRLKRLERDTSGLASHGILGFDAKRHLLLRQAQILASDGQARWLEEALPATHKAATSCAAASPLELGGRSAPARGAASGWILFRAPHAGLFLADSLGSRGDTKLAVYSSCGARQPVASNDDAHGLLAAVSFTADAGQELWIRVEGEDSRVSVGGASSIAGRVVDNAGAPIPNIPLELRSPQGGFFGSIQTAMDGSYFFPVPEGTYLLLTSLFGSSGPFLNGAYDGVICLEICRLNEATPITVPADSAVENIDLELARGAVISGRARIADTQEPLALAGIRIFDEQGREIGQAFTDAAGRYRFSRLLAGDYRLTLNHPETRDEVWPDVPCPASCQPLAGDPVSVSFEEVATQIDFEVDRLGAIEVDIVDSVTGERLGFVDLEVFNPSGGLVGNSFGQIFRVGGLSTGTYFVRASSFDYLDQLWEGIDCEDSCDPTLGTPVEVVEGETTHFSMALEPNGSVAGRMTDEETGEGIEGLAVLFSETGGFGTSRSTDSEGFYRFDNVVPRLYRVVGISDAYIDEAWDDHPCPEIDCQLVGDAVMVEPGLQTSDIDFALVRKGVVEGVIRDSLTAQLLDDVTVQLFDSMGSQVGTRFTDQDGHYRFVGVESGSKFIVASRRAYQDQLWQGIDCETGCDPLSGTAVEVANGSTATVDIDLIRRPWIEGQVTDLGTGEPLLQGIVSVFDDQGQLFGSASLGAEGRFEINDVLPGTYYALASAGDTHIPVLFGNHPCFLGIRPEGCQVADSDPIVVGAQGTVANFVLPLGGEITGAVTSGMGSEHVQGNVQIYDDSGVLVRTDFLDQGRFGVEGLEAGTYFAVTSLAERYRDELWDGIPCPLGPGTCDPTTGTPIAVIRGEVTMGVDFEIERFGSIRGSIRDGVTQELLTEGRVSVFDDTGTVVNSSNFFFEQAKFLFEGLPAGTYFLATEGFDQHLDQVFGGDICEPGPCDPTTGTAILVIDEVESGPIDIDLQSGPGYSLELLTQQGSPIVGGAIDLWNMTGQHLMTFVTDENGRADVGFEAGSYYLSTDNGQGLVDQVWEGVQCPDGPVFLGLCDLFLGNLIDLEDGQQLTEIIFVLEDPSLLFADGFESGTVEEWSASQQP